MSNSNRQIRFVLEQNWSLVRILLLPCCLTQYISPTFLTPVEERYSGLNSSSHHACNQVIIMGDTLCIQWSISKREESWPAKVSSSSSNPCRFYLIILTMKMMVKSKELLGSSNVQNPVCKDSRNLQPHLLLSYLLPH